VNATAPVQSGSDGSLAARLSLSVVIPAHNESAVIAQAIASVRRYAIEHQRPIEVVVVDDGSRDDTSARAAAAGAEPITVRVLRHERNRGKGYTVKRGMLEATGELRVFCDADMSTPIDQLDLLLPAIEEGYEVVIGSRKLPESTLRPPQWLFRRMLGTTFRIIRSFIMLRDIRDTQCGFKLFTAKATQDIFARQTVDGPAFDCEILALAQLLNYRISEIGVLWRNNPDSRIRPLRDGTNMLISLLRIRKRISQLKKEMQATS